MENTIDSLRKIVSTSISKDDATWKITEAYPEISASQADKVRDDVFDYINGTIHKAELAMFLVESGLSETAA